MRFAGKIIKSGKWWAIEVPALSVYTQGRSKADAFMMAADAVEALVNKTGFKAEVFAGEGDYFELGSNDPATLCALFLRQQRSASGQSLSTVADKLGSPSRNAYARYEHGSSVPTITKLGELLAAFAPTGDIVLGAAVATKRLAR